MSDIKLGPCCICGTTKKVRNILHLHIESPTPGRGWGCIVCHLPPNGAVAVLCDNCQDEFVAGNAKLKFICTGYPAHDGRTPYDPSIVETFDHDMSQHDATD